jgi:hypothetical protein
VCAAVDTTGAGRASPGRGGCILELLPSVLVHELLVGGHGLIRAVEVEVVLELLTSDVGVDVEVFDRGGHFEWCCGCCGGCG